MCVTNSILDNVIPNISEYMSINTYIYIIGIIIIIIITIGNKNTQ